MKVYDDEREPLGSLFVVRSYSTRLKKMKGLKTDTADSGNANRFVPVHRTLQKMLADWKVRGWPELVDRVPGEDDLIMPSREGRPRSVNHMLKRFKQDCTRIGLRHRRLHDCRRSFISQALDAGGDREFLKWVTHGAPTASGDAFDEYVTLTDWTAMCNAVSKLRIRLRAGVIRELRPATRG